MAAQVSEVSPLDVQNRLEQLVDAYLNRLQPQTGVAITAQEAEYEAKLLLLMEMAAKGVFTLRSEYLALDKVTQAGVQMRITNIQKLDELGPLTADSIWTKGLSLVGGAGALALLQAPVASWVKNLTNNKDLASISWTPAFCIVGGILGLVFMQLLVNFLTTRETANLQTCQAQSEQASWKLIVMTKVRKAALDFLKEAYRLAKELDPSIQEPLHDDTIEVDLQILNPGIAFGIILHSDGTAAKKISWRPSVVNRYEQSNPAFENRSSLASNSTPS